MPKMPKHPLRIQPHKLPSKTRKATNGRKMQIIKVCLLHGQKCYWQSLRYIPKNSQFQVKVCRAKFACNQQFLTQICELNKIGPCEKAAICPMASDACKLAVNLGAALPKKRWINCWSYSTFLKGGIPYA